MSTRVCQGCGSQLPPKTWKGRDRKWCSDRCRKDACYVRHCLDCGARLGSSDGNGPNAPKRCLSCAPKVTGAARTVWTSAAITMALREWADEHGGEVPAVRDWGGAHGVLPHTDYLAEPERWPHFQTVIRAFDHPGPWAKAVRSAGLTPRRRGGGSHLHREAA